MIHFELLEIIGPHASGCPAKYLATFFDDRSRCGHCGEDVYPHAATVDIVVPHLQLSCVDGRGVWHLPELGADLHRCNRTVSDEEVAALLDVAIHATAGGPRSLGCRA